MTREELIAKCKVYKGEEDIPWEKLTQKYDFVFWMAEEKYVWLLSDNGEKYKKAQQEQIDDFLNILKRSKIEFKGIPRLLQGIMIPFAHKGTYKSSVEEEERKLVEKIFPNYLAR